MTDKTIVNEYIPGNYLMTCDRCGLRFRRSELKNDGFIKGLMVCRTCWDFKPVFPSPPPDRHAVPIPRPEQDIQAYGTAYDLITIGLNLFPDPNILPANDGLWSNGIDSQQHVKTEYYSKKLTGVNSDITVTGLEVGETYRLKASTWTPDTAKIRINGHDSFIFLTPSLEQWYTEFIYFVAEATSIVLTFEANVSGNWYDDIHVQKYTVVEQLLKPSEIIENKPNNNVVDDNTVDGTVVYFFSFEDDNDFNAVGFDDGTMVDQLE